MADRKLQIDTTWDRYLASVPLDELVGQLSDAEIRAVIGEELAMQLRVYTRKRLDSLQSAMQVEEREQMLKAWEPAHRFDPGKRNQVNRPIAPHEEYGVQMAVAKLRTAMQAPPNPQPLGHGSRSTHPFTPAPPVVNAQPPNPHPLGHGSRLTQPFTPAPPVIPAQPPRPATPPQPPRPAAPPQPKRSEKWPDWVDLQKLMTDFDEGAKRCEDFIQHYSFESPRDQQRAVQMVVSLQKNFVEKADLLNAKGDTDFRLARGELIRDINKLIERLEALAGATNVDWNM